MLLNKTTLKVIAIIVIISIISLWAWYKSNWWLLLGIPFSLFFFSNSKSVGTSLGYVLTIVLIHMLGKFQFTVSSWFFFLCGLMSYAFACLIYGTEQSNREKKAKTLGDNRTFEEHEEESENQRFLNSPWFKNYLEEKLKK
jgi:hypothetical protein